MALLQRFLKRTQPSYDGGAAARRAQQRSLRFEPLEAREVLNGLPLTLVNHTTLDAGGTLAFQDSQINIAIYAKTFDGADPPFYYFDHTGAAHATAGLNTIPTFTLSQVSQQTGPNTYVLELPELLPGSSYGINSARMYFSMNTPLVLTVNGDAAGSVNAPTPGNDFVDFIEFSFNAPANAGNLNIDTTNVDAFALPIQIKVDATDLGVQPSEVGTATTRVEVFKQYEAYLQEPGGAAYDVTLWPVEHPEYGPYRILSPGGFVAPPPEYTALQVSNTTVQVQTNLISAITAVQTTFLVYGDQAFPDPAVDGPYNVVFGAEEMTVTASVQQANGTALWTVVRGANGTTPEAHAPADGFIFKVGPAISASQTTLTFVGSGNYPAFPFNVLLENEIIKVTGLKSNNPNGSTTWNVERGQFGTTAEAHVNGKIVHYNGVTSIALNSYFNEAIDALFTKYHNVAPADRLQIYSNADGAGQIYYGEVIQQGGAYVMHFTDAGENVDYYVYYPFFEENRYLWAGYTPQFTPGPAPAWSDAVHFAAISPSMMVFANNGVFADNKFQTGLTTDEQLVLGDLENQMVAALNRGVALMPGYTADDTGSWKDPNFYYSKNTDGQVYNRYAEFLHKDTVSIGGLNYGFAYDDQAGQASDISTTDFTQVAVTLGPWAAHDDPNPGPGPGPGPGPSPDPGAQITKRKFLASHAAREIPDGGIGPHQQSVQQLTQVFQQIVAPALLEPKGAPDPAPTPMPVIDVVLENNDPPSYGFEEQVVQDTPPQPPAALPEFIPISQMLFSAKRLGKMFPF